MLGNLLNNDVDQVRMKTVAIELEIKDLQLLHDLAKFLVERCKLESHLNLFLCSNFLQMDSLQMFRQKCCHEKEQKDTNQNKWNNENIHT